MATPIKRGDKAWWNGKIVNAQEIRISPFAHGLHYGTGAFEGIRAYKQKKGGGAVFRLSDHIQRLIESFKIIGFKLPFSKDQIIEGCLQACRANAMDECYLRPIAFIGDGPIGVDPGAEPPIDVGVLIWEWGNYLGDQGKKRGARLKTSSMVRPHVNSAMTKGKITGQYVNGSIAKREALAQGFDEALLVDPEGFMTEGTGENLFIVKDGAIKTSPPGSLLRGITRDTVMHYFSEIKKLPVQEMRFTRDELWCADEVFLSGTAAEITPVSMVDGRSIGFGANEGKPGTVAMELAEWYDGVVRGVPEGLARKWLTTL